VPSIEVPATEWGWRSLLAAVGCRNFLLPSQCFYFHHDMPANPAYRRGKMIKLRNLSGRVAPGLWLAATLAVLGMLGLPRTVSAQSGPSGESIVPQGAVESAIDGQTGSLVFQMVPAKAPNPTHTNGAAQTRLYFVMYPLNSSVPANSLNCQPDNCDHLNVLPFANTDYGALPGSNLACQDFNQGQACSEVEGHDHLRAGSPPLGQSTSIWSAYLVVFTDQGFNDGAINHRITTLGQLYSRICSGDVTVLPTPLTVTLTRVPQKLYQLGTPLEVNYP